MAEKRKQTKNRTDKIKNKITDLNPNINNYVKCKLSKYIKSNIDLNKSRQMI